MAKKEVTYAEAMAEIEKILARLRNEETVSYTHLTLPTN